MIKWEEVKLGECITTLKGFAFKSEWYQFRGVPLARVSDFTENSISTSKIKYISDDLAQVYSKYKLKTKDIIIQTVGSWQSNPASIVGKVVNVPSSLNGALLNQNAVKIIPNKKVDQNFLYYRLKDDNFKYHNLNNAQGAANQASITLPSIKFFKFKLPPIKIQKKIGKILSSYDDLINNNIERVKLLEESARCIYERWFLTFKIDKKNLDIDQSTGLPFGWKEIKVKDYIETISKGPSLNYNLVDQNGVEVLNQSCIRDGEIELEKILIANKLKDNQKSAYLRINDILINSMGHGTLGRVSKNVSIDKKMIIHNCITFLRAKDKYSQFMLFYFISKHQNYFETLAQGSTGQSTLKNESISNLIITIPDNKTLKRFDSIISPIWRQIGVLKRKNQLLKEARDILLSRLMIGMINVEKIDITV